MKRIDKRLIAVCIAMFSFWVFPAQGQDVLLEVVSSKQVEFLLIDAQGRRCGYDPISNQYFDEIPFLDYGHEGFDDIEGGLPSSYLCILSNHVDHPLQDGAYVIRAVGVSSGKWLLSLRGYRGTTNMPRTSLGGEAAPGLVKYLDLNYSNNPGVPITLAKVPPTNQVSGGIFNTTGTTLSVKAKPSVNFTSSSLKTLVATIRWLTSYGITLSTPSSPTYGFVKWDSVITSGNYSYQKFRAAGSVAINWQADVEYELFTTSVSGGTGTGDFELTNAIPGGEWFVDINYSDKSDTLFYHPIASNTPLPIQLLYFTATVLVDNRVRCDWATLTETNNYGFFVQKSRSATSGFADIPGSFVPGHGTTNEPHYYSYIDQNTSSGRWYYRLKQIDLDGTTHYTNPVQVYIPDGQIDMEAFAASSPSQQQVNLSWATRRETDNNRFEMQASRGDSITFRTIPNSAVPGHGTTNTRHLYSYHDVRPNTGTWFFRLKQFNQNGRARYTNMIRVDVR